MIREILPKMKILYISTVFPKYSSTIYTDLAETLVENGHSVVVLAADSDVDTKMATSFEHGCEVIRVKTQSIYNTGVIKKGFSTVVLPINLKRAMKQYLMKRDFDLILFESPPSTLHGVVGYAKKLFGAKSFLMMKDIFPQNAVDLGLMKKGLAYHYFKQQERALYDIADVIGCMSQANMDYLAMHSHVPVKKMIIFPNTKKIKEHPVNDNSVRNKYGIPLNKVVFVFGGNMGKPQGIDFLTSAIRASERIENAFFVLVGRGTERDRALEKLNGCSNYVMIDNLQRDEYEKLIASCDVGIVSLDSRFTIPNYPSRILSYMEYEMPVIAATDSNTDFSALIKESGCGYWVRSDSVADFVSATERMALNPEKRVAMGKSGRKYMEKNLDTKISVDLIEMYMSNCDNLKITY